MATKSNALEAEAPVSAAGTLKPQYLEAVSRVERLHRRLLDLIKDEFDRMGWDDINPVQALLMFNIGDAEMTAGELRSRGYYLGSNVSYNLKKLVETGYIFQERSRADRRSVRIRLTPKGEEVAEVIDELMHKDRFAEVEKMFDQAKNCPLILRTSQEFNRLTSVNSYMIEKSKAKIELEGAPVIILAPLETAKAITNNPAMQRRLNLLKL